MREMVDKRLESLGNSLELNDDDMSLVDLGVIDSFGFLELVAELEEKTGVYPDFAEADPDEFTSINGLVKLIVSSD